MRPAPLLPPPPAPPAPPASLLVPRATLHRLGRCALGAGGKADPCQLHLGRLTEVVHDPIATTMLKRMRKQSAASGGGGGGGGCGGGGGGGGAAVEAEAAEAAAAAEAGELRGGSTAGRWWWSEPAHSVLCVASSEKQSVSLLPLPPSVPREQAADLSTPTYLLAY